MRDLVEERQPHLLQVAFFPTAGKVPDVARPDADPRRIDPIHLPVRSSFKYPQPIPSHSELQIVVLRSLFDKHRHCRHRAGDLRRQSAQRPLDDVLRHDQLPLAKFHTARHTTPAH